MPGTIVLDESKTELNRILLQLAAACVRGGQKEFLIVRRESTLC